MNFLLIFIGEIMQTEIIYGLHAIEKILEKQPETVIEFYIVNPKKTDKRKQAILGYAKQNGINIQTIEQKKLTKLCDTEKNQGIAIKVKLKAELGESNLKEMLDEINDKSLFLILDNITDPHNLGAIFRTADVFGVNAIIAPKDKSVGITATVRKVASGATETVPFVRVSNLSRTIEQMKESGIWMVGTAMDTDLEIKDVDFARPIGIIMGSEGDGMRKLTTKHCDYLAKIPLMGEVESLNVSVACGICLYEARRT